MYRHAYSQYCNSNHTAVTRAGAESIISKQSKEELGQFIGTSVLPNTSRVYDQHWTQWKQFLKSEVDQDDPFLLALREDEKSSLVALMKLRRHEAGLRGKAATSFTAGIRMRFAQETLPTAFLDSAVIAMSRSSCRLKPAELRERRNSGGSTNAKLPVCESILTDMRVHLWRDVAGMTTTPAAEWYI